MVRATLNQTSFAGGEWSPRAIARTDIDRYGTALKQARNGYPIPTGAFKRRPGTFYVATSAETLPMNSMLVPFIQGRSQAWMIEFGHLTARIYNLDGTYTGTELTTPYTSAAVMLFDWAQSAETMWIFSANTPIQRLQRHASGLWTISEAPITPYPFAEIGRRSAYQVNLSLATVGVGRTATATGASFLAGDIGRAITYNAGIAVITAFTSTTVVTVEITRAFASTALPLSQWVLEGSPQANLTPSAKDPLGATITLTLDADGWRSTDVGSFVRVNGGLVRISAYTSALIVSGVIEKELTATVAAPALAWSIESAVWSSTVLGYPITGTVRQQRLIVGGTAIFPRTIWGSKVGEPLNFQSGTNDDDAFSYTIDSDESSPLVYLSSQRDLVALTQSAEYSVRSGIEKPLTPTNVRIVPESNHGCAQVRPVSVGRELMIAQRAGLKVRAVGYRYDFDGYSAPDITALADHVTAGGIISMAYQQEPYPMLWATTGDGKLLSCTIDRDQTPSVVGWAPHDTDGAFEWVAIAPYGDREVVWCIVRRVINGSAVRMIERFDDTLQALHPDTATEGHLYGCTVDCGVVVDNALGQSVFATEADHLEAKTVDVVADGSYMGQFHVTPAGVALPRTSKRTLIGLHFKTTATLLTPELGTGEGSAQGNAARTGELTMRFLDTIGAEIVDNEGGRQTLPFRTFGAGILDNAPIPFTGLERITKLGWNRGVAELSVVQDKPLPLQLLAVMRKHTTNSG